MKTIATLVHVPYEMGYMFESSVPAHDRVYLGDHKSLLGPSEELVRKSEAEEEITKAMLREPCGNPPSGWWCSRGAGHEGPCAARLRTKPWIKHNE